MSAYLIYLTVNGKLRSHFSLFVFTIGISFIHDYDVCVYTFFRLPNDSCYYKDLVTIIIIISIHIYSYSLSLSLSTIFSTVAYLTLPSMICHFFRRLNGSALVIHIIFLA